MNKIVEKLIGLVVVALFGFAVFLLTNFFDGFVTRADYNKDKIEMALIKQDLTHLKDGQLEIKKLLSK